MSLVKFRYFTRLKSRNSLFFLELNLIPNPKIILCYVFLRRWINVTITRPIKTNTTNITTTMFRRDLPICSWKNQVKITVNRSNPPVRIKIWIVLSEVIFSLIPTRNINRGNLNTEGQLAILATFKQHKH